MILRIKYSTLRAVFRGFRRATLSDSIARANISTTAGLTTEPLEVGWGLLSQEKSFVYIYCFLLLYLRRFLLLFAADVAAAPRWYVAVVKGTPSGAYVALFTLASFRCSRDDFLHFTTCMTISFFFSRWLRSYSAIVAARSLWSRTTQQITSKNGWPAPPKIFAEPLSWKARLLLTYNTSTDCLIDLTHLDLVAWRGGALLTMGAFFSSP
jgi:hypothetical protein